jgi:hypothetical protein
MSISLTLILEVEMGHVINVFDTLDAFDVEVFIFQNIMWVEGVKVIKPFLKVYDLYQVHNMLAIMLDPCFKFVENYVGHGGYIFVLLLKLANVIIQL